MSKDIKDGRAMKQRGGVCWSERMRRWRAYLHIGNRQVWSCAKYRKDEKEFAERDLEEARQRFAKEVNKATLSAAAKRLQRKMPAQIDLLEQLVEMLHDGSFEVSATVYDEKTGVLRKKRIGGPYKDHGAARLRAIAYLKGVPFNLDTFRQYLKTHDLIAELVEKNRRLAEEKILPLLKVRDMQGTTRRGERVIIGHRWQPVRRYKKVTWKDESLTVYTEKQLSGVHLRIIEDKEG